MAWDTSSDLREHTPVSLSFSTPVITRVTGEMAIFAKGARNRWFVFSLLIAVLRDQERALSVKEIRNQGL
jgi:hypothetical protein